LAGYTEGDQITNAEVLAMDVEMLVPAALGGVITAANVDQIRARIILEAANGPIHPDADEALYKRGVTILPDILCNAGGVTVSYFEWVQNLQFYKWGINRVRQELDHVLTQAFEEVWREAYERQVSLRTAAYMIAIRRVHRATLLAGI
jgi:glutamate dehydrogenase (NAD(P)+)